jgi:hypothetical protein
LPRKPREIVPGPGEYSIQAPPEEPLTAKGGYISQLPPFDPGNVTEKGVPGPAYYNATIEPKKISFLFNAAEKWTN